MTIAHDALDLWWSSLETGDKGTYPTTQTWAMGTAPLLACTVGKQAVRILLECFLVSFIFHLSISKETSINYHCSVIVDIKVTIYPSGFSVDVKLLRQPVSLMMRPRCSRRKAITTPGQTD